MAAVLQPWQILVAALAGWISRQLLDPTPLASGLRNPRSV